jgi:hypothetical protein
MKAVEQFMEEFFAERAQFHQKYYDIFPGPNSHRTAAERLESAKHFGSFAIATTRMDGGTHYSRLRYRLRPEGESWMIVKINFQCGRCRGTGKKAGSEEPCSKCKGEGWI